MAAEHGPNSMEVFRGISKNQLQSEGTLFPVRKAWWYVKRPRLSFNDPWNGPKGSQGDGYFVAPNPPFGAVFTYHIGKGFKTKKAKRQAEEKLALSKKKSVGFPGWDVVETERREVDPKIIFEVKNSEGDVVRRLNGPVTKGFHRVAYPMRSQKIILQKLVLGFWLLQGIIQSLCMFNRMGN